MKTVNVYFEVHTRTKTYTQICVYVYINTYTHIYTNTDGLKFLFIFSLNSWWKSLTDIEMCKIEALGNQRLVPVNFRRLYQYLNSLN